MPRHPDVEQKPRHPPSTPPDEDAAQDPVMRIEDEEAEEDEDDADGLGVRPGG